jgi:hypothetical protein
MSRNSEFQKKIKKAERTAYIATAFSFLASILLLFSVYDPTFSVLGKKEVTPIYKIKLKTEFI